MWKEIPPFSCSVGERKLMNHFVVSHSLSAFSFRLGKSPNLKNLLHEFFRSRRGVPIGYFELTAHFFNLRAQLAFGMEETIPAGAQIFDSLAGDPAGHEQSRIWVRRSLHRTQQDFP